MRWRAFIAVFCGCTALAGCSKREKSNPEAAEWADIQAMADDAVPVAVDSAVAAETNHVDVVVPEGFGEFIARLEAMKTVERKPGQTLLTGERLVLDHGQRFVRMEQNVLVQDDRGTLESENLVGRFTVSNEVESIEAGGGVVIRSEGREAVGENASYDYQNGFVRLEGKASVWDGGNRLSGERIELWIRGDRKLVCEPNALLEVSGGPGLGFDGLSSTGGVTEIRSDRVVYDESKGVAEVDGNVRIRDPRAAMNCGNVRLFLKEGNEIDWIEARSEVIIQSDDRKALAERATYHADEGKFTLEGEPKVKQGLNVMTGDRIIFWHETRRMVCEPNARVLLYLDEATKAKFMKDLND